MIPTFRWRAFSLMAKSLRQEGKTEEAQQAERASLYAVSDVDLDSDLVFKAQLDCEAAALLSIGRYNKDKGKKEAAAAAFTQVLDRGKASPQYRCVASLKLAELAEKTQDKLAAYDEVLRIPDAGAEYISQALLAIGRLYLDQGDKDKARETFTRIVEMEGAPTEYRDKAQAHLDAMD
jgi:tetratricopeptide (TPR) repeat protein